MARCALPVDTMSFPRGKSEIGISLRLARTKGIPMTVMHGRTPVTACPIASQSPEKMNQKTLPIPETALAPGFLSTVRPNGQSAKSPMRNDAKPNGIPMTVMHQRTPTNM
jgi:hypothetical protein